MKVYIAIIALILLGACTKEILKIKPGFLVNSKKLVLSPVKLAIHNSLLVKDSVREYYRVMILEKEARDSVEDFSIKVNTTFTNGEKDLDSVEIRQVIDLYFFNNGGVIYYSPGFKLKYLAKNPDIPKDLFDPLTYKETGFCDTVWTKIEKINIFRLINKPGIPRSLDVDTAKLNLNICRKCNDVWNGVECLKRAWERVDSLVIHLKSVREKINYQLGLNRNAQALLNRKKELNNGLDSLKTFKKKIDEKFSSLIKNKYKKMKQGYIESYDAEKKIYTIVLQDILHKKMDKNPDLLTLRLQFRPKKNNQREALEIIDIKYKNTIASQGKGYLTIKATDLFNFGSTNNPNSYFYPSSKDNQATLWFKRIKADSAKTLVDSIRNKKERNDKNLMFY